MSGLFIKIIFLTTGPWGSVLGSYNLQPVPFWLLKRQLSFPWTFHGDITDLGPKLLVYVFSAALKMDKYVYLLSSHSAPLFAMTRLVATDSPRRLAKFLFLFFIFLLSAWLPLLWEKKILVVLLRAFITFLFLFRTFNSIHKPCGCTEVNRGQKPLWSLPWLKCQLLQCMPGHHNAHRQCGNQALSFPELLRFKENAEILSNMYEKQLHVFALQSTHTWQHHGHVCFGLTTKL